MFEPSARAQPPTRQATRQATAPRRFRVRIELSKGAAKRLSALRVRRLLQLELDDLADLDATDVGTLEGDDLIRVWIDVPIDRRAIVEVRRVEGSFAVRALAIGEYPSDVAAEVVALAASEMVRVQTNVKKTPAPLPPPRAPRTPTDGNGVALSGGTTLITLPSSTPAVFVGPELGLELRQSAFAQRLYGRWQIGAGRDLGRWLEFGASLEFRWNVAPRWRLHLAAKTGFVDVFLPNAARIEGENTAHAYTVRMAGELGLEARIAPHHWLAISVEPGAALRPLDIGYQDGAQATIGGFAFGINLSLSATLFEQE